MLIFPGFLVGVLLGVVVHRGDFCMHSALREIVARRPGASLRAYLVALGVQLAIVNTLGELGWLEIPMPPVAVAAAFIGGLVFGIGMVLAKGCATSIWSRVGTGSGGATVAAVGFAAGATLTARWPLAAVNEWLSPSEGAPDISASLTELFGVSTWIAVAAGVALIIALLTLLRRSSEQTTHWPWAVTGLALGAVGVLAWLTGAFAGWNWGLSITGPARSLVNVVIFARPTALNWGTVMLIGLPVGTFLSARVRGPVSWRLPSRTEGARKLGGGLLMGVGGTLALGCNIGNALTGLSVLAVNSGIATIGIVVGGVLSIAIGALRIRSDQPEASPMASPPAR